MFQVIDTISTESRNKLLIWVLNEAIRQQDKQAIDLWFEKMGHKKGNK